MAGGGREAKELHFYPGEKRLLFVVDGKLDLNVEAWGGPAIPIPRGPGEKFGATPTTPGRFRVGWIGKYQTTSWDFSRIPWGTRIKPHPTDATDVLYEVSPGQWRSVKKKVGVSRSRLESEYQALYRDRKLPDTWVFNDFGPIAVRYYQDRNNNRKQDANEPLSGEMFHTTPENEANAKAPLGESHACIHLRPIDRDVLIAHRAFALGTLVVVHDYGETAGIHESASVAR